MNIQPGDIVELIRIDKLDHEEENWILSEESKPKIGNRYKVIEIHKNNYGFYWMDLEGLECAHPAEKFKKLPVKEDRIR